MRVFLGWLRGERGHCGVVAIPDHRRRGRVTPHRAASMITGSSSVSYITLAEIKAPIAPENAAFVPSVSYITLVKIKIPFECELHHTGFNSLLTIFPSVLDIVESTFLASQPSEISIQGDGHENTTAIGSGGRSRDSCLRRR
jgi:hypothetical protein